jgi:site-specific recombinase XerD
VVEYLTKKQILQLQARTRVLRDWLLVTTQYQTGCTVSELTHIKREDIREHDILIDGRVCRVSTELLQKLSRYLKNHDSPYVFVSRQQPQLTDKRVQQIIKKRLKELDPKLSKATPHVLRYSHIVHAAKQNIPLRSIMDQTGLGELRLTQILSDVLPAQENAYERMFT